MLLIILLLSMTSINALATLPEAFLVLFANRHTHGHKGIALLLLYMRHGTILMHGVHGTNCEKKHAFNNTPENNQK